MEFFFLIYYRLYKFPLYHKQFYWNVELSSTKTMLILKPSGWSQFDFGRAWHYLIDEAIVLADDLCLEFAQLLFDILVRHAFNRHWFQFSQESLDDLLPLLWIN